MTSSASGPGVRARLLGLLPASRWVRGYPRSSLRPDVTAGLTVAVLLVPQSMAYASLAGMPPEAGLYAAIVSLLVYAALGTSSSISVAPVAIDSLLVAAAVGPLADGDVGRYVAAAGLLAVMTGSLQVLLGLLRLGALANFLSVPVMLGFTSAAALTIAASQVEELLGLDVDRGAGTSFLDAVRSTVPALGTAHLPTVVLAAGALALLAVLPRVVPRVPAALLVVAVATLVAGGLRLDQQGLAVLGEVPSGLPVPRLPLLEADLVRQLLPAALTLAVVSYLESISTAKAFAARTRERVDPDQELLAVGAANVASGLFRGFAVAGGFSRGAVNVRAGARTQLSGVVASLVLVVAVTVLTPLFTYLPKAALAAVIVLAVASLVDLRGARRVLHVRRTDGLALLVTFVATLGIGVAWGLFVGVVFSLLVFVARTARPHVAEIGRVEGTTRYRNVARWTTHTDPRLLVLRMDGPLYFANTRFLEQRVQERLAGREGVQHVLLLASAIADVDASGAQLLEELDEDLRALGVTLHLVTVRGPVRDILDNSGLLPRLVDSGRLHPNVEAAVRALTGPEGSPLLAGDGDGVPAPRDPA